MKTAVLGAGKMGIWFAKFCQENGDTIVLADRKKEKLVRLKQELDIEVTSDFAEAVRESDRVIICVSITAFEETVKKIAPAVHQNQPIMDICSIKEYPVKVMHENLKSGLILGTHPVFGPGSKGVKHKAYILTPVNPKESEYAENYRKLLEKQGAHVFTMSPQKHDQLMTMVLGLPHFLGLAACETLVAQKDFPESKKVAGTTYRMLFTLAEATALETPDLYANLQTKLPKVQKIETQFLKNAQEWLDLIKDKNSDAIIERMEQLKSKLKLTDSDFAKSYEVMYRMLEATEE